MKVPTTSREEDLAYCKKQMQRLFAEHKSLTNLKLGEIAGLKNPSGPSVSYWRNGHKLPSLSAQKRITDYFGLSKDYFSRPKTFDEDTQEMLNSMISYINKYGEDFEWTIGYIDPFNKKLEWDSLWYIEESDIREKIYLEHLNNNVPPVFDEDGELVYPGRNMSEERKDRNRRISSTIAYLSTIFPICMEFQQSNTNPIFTYYFLRECEIASDLFYKLWADGLGNYIHRYVSDYTRLKLEYLDKNPRSEINFHDLMVRMSIVKNFQCTMYDSWDRKGNRFDYKKLKKEIDGFNSHRDFTVHGYFDANGAIHTDFYTKFNINESSSSQEEEGSTANGKKER